MRFFLILISIVILNDSCVVKKRLHRKGWYIQWVNDKRTVTMAKESSTISKNKTQDSSKHKKIDSEEDSNLQENDTTMSNVYDKLNNFRKELQLCELILDESLELAAAQHGCWLALYNFRIDSANIILQSNETDLYLAKKLNDPVDRVKMYTNRPLFLIAEYLNYYYYKPDSEDIFKFIKNKLVSKRYKYFGYWVIKYETKKHRPIWYLVFLVTD